MGFFPTPFGFVAGFDLEVVGSIRSIFSHWKKYIRHKRPRERIAGGRVRGEKGRVC